MSAVDTALKVAKYVAVAGVAYAGFKFAMKVKDKVEAGAETVKALADTAMEVVTEDLNPVSPKNVVYSGVNSVAQQVTNDPSWNLGSKLWEWFNPAQVAKEKGLLTGASVSDVQQQAQMIQNDDFRRAEITAQNIQAAAEEQADAKMSRSKTAFRLSEIIDQNKPGTTDYGSFLRNLDRVRNSS